MGLEITDFAEISVLQKLQDAFSKMVGVAAITTDSQGKPVTEGSGFTEFCMKYTRQSGIGCERCELCDRLGAKEAMDLGCARTYVCHAGLIDFSAPVIINGELTGCIIGGQVLTKMPEYEDIKRTAEEIGVEPESYWEAVKKVPVMSEGRIKAAADFLYIMAGILAEVAYSRYKTLNDNREIERVSDLKSDFLASMSHEIRTPMNAVIGMTEMALREDLPDTARNYIGQIKSSSKILLNIINDILDFSKIESGKMDIIPDEYEILSMCNDIASIVETRLKDKNVELLFSIEPTIPAVLYGDSNRVRQILINLANNAVKFTRKGMINISIDYKRMDDENIMLLMCVEDTGCGIKQSDISRIFDSFQQVDSKRNRGAEGTGLGLAICKQLLGIMHGDIQVQSEYGKGSKFYVSIPQKVIDNKPVISIQNPEDIVVIGHFRNRYLAKQFFADAKRLGLMSFAMISPDRLKWGLESYADLCADKKIFVFTEERDMDDDLRENIKAHPDIIVVEMVDFFTDRKNENDNWRVMRKPISTNVISMAIAGEDFVLNMDEDADSDIDFIAPEAEVMIVDDNSINLTVTEGLLEPLRMKIYCMESGVDAIDFIEKHPVDIIFMDHMMPELDGIETTRMIRRFYPQYADIPIIALTANVVEDMQKVFLSEGMDDFVAKPIEVRTLIQKVKKWLPPEKVIKNRMIVEMNENDQPDEQDEKIVIADLDTEFACGLLGGRGLFKKILKEYYGNIPIKSEKIMKYKNDRDYENYTIEVHSLKSTSKQIGALALSELAAALEKAGHERDEDFIEKHTDEMMDKYKSYIDILKSYCEEEHKEPQIIVSEHTVIEKLDEMSEAVDELDIDHMDEVIKQMELYKFSGKTAEIFSKLCDAVKNIDVELCTDIIENWKNMMKKE